MQKDSSLTIRKLNIDGTEIDIDNWTTGLFSTLFRMAKDPNTGAYISLPDSISSDYLSGEQLANAFLNIDKAELIFGKQFTKDARIDMRDEHLHYISLLKAIHNSDYDIAAEGLESFFSGAKAKQNNWLSKDKRSSFLSQYYDEEAEKGLHLINNKDSIVLSLSQDDKTFIGCFPKEHFAVFVRGDSTKPNNVFSTMYVVNKNQVDIAVPMNEEQRAAFLGIPVKISNGLKKQSCAYTLQDAQAILAESVKQTKIDSFRQKVND